MPSLLFLLVLAANSDVRPATQAEFREQARLCGVPLEPEPRAEEGAAVWLSDNGRELYLRDNRPKPHVKCMYDWGVKRGLLVIRWRT
jgi:hypothetical protein